jgi:hypothetical protein
MRVIITRKVDGEMIDLSALKKAQILRALENYIVAPQAYHLSLQPEESTPVDDATPSELTTIGEWLATKDVQLTRPQKHRFTRAVSEAYTEAFGRLPRKITRQDSKGKWNIRANGFRSSEFPILERCLKETLEDG